MSQYPGLLFVQNETHLLVRVSPSAERGGLDADALHAALVSAGYGQWALDQAALNTVRERYADPLAEFELPIAEARDAGFTLEISADALQASIDVLPAAGGKALTSEAIYRVLDEAGVSAGVDTAAVEAACAAQATGRFVVATGSAAEDGENARFELLVADARDRTPQLNAQGLIDFREQGAIPTVEAEQALMRRIPATSGTVGRTVRGEVIEPAPGRNEGFAEKLVGAYVARDDANLLRAVFSGQPVCSARGVSVEQVLRVRNVNMASGNITFDGTVSIEGEVLPGMKVHATGDVIVGGIVDGAEVEAGGDVRVAGGIIAKARVRAAGSVSARFAESAHIEAGTTIAIEDSALQSELQANNQILVGTSATQRGRLAGGSARAMLLIRTPILGSPTGGVTRLLLGVNPVLEAEYQALQHRIDHLRDEEDKLEKLIKHLTTHGDKAGMLERAKASWQKALQGWAKLMPEREELERQLNLVAGARVEIGAAVAGAVDLTFGKKLLHVRQSYDAGYFAAEDERIAFFDTKG